MYYMGVNINSVQSGSSERSLLAVSIIVSKNLLGSQTYGVARAACAKNGSFLNDLPLKP